MDHLFIGLMSGTSMDALDAALVDFSGPPRLVAAVNHPLPDDVRGRLADLYRSGTASMQEVMDLDVRMGYLFAEAAHAVIARSRQPHERIRAIGSHGQTVYHHAVGDAPTSLQIGDPNVIAERTGLTTVADFRRRDIAAGGQGAPLAPAFHQVFFRSPDEDRVILNVGGIANVTLLPSGDASRCMGFDTGPGNALMDAWAQRHLNRAMDTQGQWAAGGVVDQTLLQALLADPYFQQRPPKSTGLEHFNLRWLDRLLDDMPVTPSPRDIQSTLCALTAVTVSDAIRRFMPSCKRVLVCGGGVHNSELQRRLQTLLPHCPLSSTGNHGLDPDWVEAVTFAWLAKQALDGVAPDLCTVTGARHPVVLGGIYPGRGR